MERHPGREAGPQSEASPHTETDGLPKEVMSSEVEKEEEMNRKAALRHLALSLPLLVAALGMALPAPLAGQTAKLGDRVRVSAPEHMEQPCIGRVMATADPLVVKEEDGTLHVIPQRQIQRLEISRGRVGSRQTVLGVAVGLVAGGAIGFLVAKQPACAAEESSCELDRFDREAEIFLSASLGGLAGAVTGYAFTPEQWTSVWQRQPGAEVAVMHRGLLVRLALPGRAANSGARR
jgi:hypothetical protein